MNESQQRAWDRYYDDWVIDVPARETSTSISPTASINLREIFGRELEDTSGKSNLIIEIGSGNGETLIPHAAAHPELNYLSFEVFQPSVASMLSRMGREGVSNVRVILANGVEGLQRLIEPESVRELWTFFADPWHKKKHHKRRLINRDFGALVASRLTTDGCWRIATDWADYAEWITDELHGHPDLVGGPVPRWAGRTETKYERRGIDAGREIHDFCYRRRGAEVCDAA